MEGKADRKLFESLSVLVRRCFQSPEAALVACIIAHVFFQAEHRAALRQGFQTQERVCFGAHKLRRTNRVYAIRAELALTVVHIRVHSCHWCMGHEIFLITAARHRPRSSEHNRIPTFRATSRAAHLPAPRPRPVSLPPTGRNRNSRAGLVYGGPRLKFHVYVAWSSPNSRRRSLPLSRGCGAILPRIHSSCPTEIAAAPTTR